MHNCLAITALIGLLLGSIVIQVCDQRLYRRRLAGDPRSLLHQPHSCRQAVQKVSAHARQAAISNFEKLSFFKFVNVVTPLVIASFLVVSPNMTLAADSFQLDTCTENPAMWSPG